MTPKLNLFLTTGAAFLISLGAFAGPVISGGGVGDATVYMTCKNESTNFEIRGTAVSSFKQGLIENRDDKFLSLKCEPDSSLAPQPKSGAGVVLWSCREYPFHDGNILVSVVKVGRAKQILAHVYQMEMFPLTPKKIKTLKCQ